MSSAHPVDSAGVPLPDGSWPDQRGTGGPLDVVRRWCNSINREQGGEAWRDVGELSAWLAVEGYDTFDRDDRHLEQALELRDRLWRSLVQESLEPLTPVLETVRLMPELVDGRVLLRAEGDGLRSVAGRLVSAIVAAQTDGSWGRLKVCRRCSWVFVDHSRNRSGTWCSMSACGGREKARAYRARRRPAPDEG